MPRWPGFYTGHLLPDDDRDPITGCVGCRWPSMFQKRLFLYAGFASNDLSVLATTGLIMERHEPSVSESFVQWRGTLVAEHTYNFWLTRQEFPEIGKVRQTSQVTTTYTVPNTRVALFNYGIQANVATVVGCLSGLNFFDGDEWHTAVSLEWWQLPYGHDTPPHGWTPN